MLRRNFLKLIGCLLFAGYYPKKKEGLSKKELESVVDELKNLCLDPLSGDFKLPTNDVCIALVPEEDKVWWFGEYEIWIIEETQPGYFEPRFAGYYG